VDRARAGGAGWHAATATLRVFDHPREELSLLGEPLAGEASAGWFGLTVLGARDA